MHKDRFHSGPTLRSFLIAAFVLALFVALGVAFRRSAEARYNRIVKHGCSEKAWCWGQLGVHGK